MLDMLSRKSELLFVAAGGLASIALISLLEASDDAPYDIEQEWDNKDAALQKLVDEVRKDAKWAMDECRNDADREKVYGQVRDDIQRFQTKLQNAGDEIIDELRSEIIGDTTDDEALDERIARFVNKMNRVTGTLNQTLEDLKTTSARR